MMRISTLLVPIHVGFGNNTKILSGEDFHILLLRPLLLGVGGAPCQILINCISKGFQIENGSYLRFL